MKLVFDIQSLQSASRLRGIGRYTHSLITALIESHQEHEIILLVSGAFCDDHPRLVAEFEDLYPGTQCAVCLLPGPSSADHPGAEVGGGDAQPCFTLRHHRLRHSR